LIDVKSRRAYPLLTKQLKQRRKKKESKDKVKRGRGRSKLLFQGELPFFVERGE
jgi:hypothetical protein